MNMIRPWALLLGLAAAFCTLEARAQVFGCRVDATPTLDFGRPGANPTAQVDVASGVAVSCLGGLGQQVKVCIGINVSRPGNTLLPYRQLRRGGQRIDYQIYRDPARTQVWGRRNDAGGAAPLEVIITLDQPVFGSVGAGSTGTLPVYGRIIAGQSGLGAGTYNSTMNNSDIAATTNVNATCGSFNSNRQTFTATATATLLGSCTIVASDLSFGIRTSLAGNIDASSSLGVTCTADTAYRVSLNGGSVTGNIADRRMGLNGTAPGAVGYQLYRDAGRSQVWGDGSGASTTVIGAGTGTGTPTTLTVYGRVPPQPMPAAGLYRDTVTATVEY